MLKYQTQRNKNSEANLIWRFNLRGKKKPMSKETKEKIKISCMDKNKGNKRPDVTEYNKRRKDIFKHSKKTKKKIAKFCKAMWTIDKRKEQSKILQRVWQNEELLKRRSELSKGKNNPMYGVHLYAEKSGNWQGGKSFEPYPLGWTRTFKEQIRYRDGYKCQKCGVPETECMRKLDVHHIDYDKKNIKPKNLISLCQSCHMKTNCDRKNWTEYFSRNDRKNTKEDA